MALEVKTDDVSVTDGVASAAISKENLSEQIAKLTLQINAKDRRIAEINKRLTQTTNAKTALETKKTTLEALVAQMS